MDDDDDVNAFFDEDFVVGGVLGSLLGVGFLTGGLIGGMLGDDE